MANSSCLDLRPRTITAAEEIGVLRDRMGPDGPGARTTPRDAGSGLPPQCTSGITSWAKRSISSS